MKKVLIVEDDRDINAILSEELTKAGFSTYSVFEGGAAVFSAADECRPDIIVLDLILPRMYGWEVLGKLKNSPRHGSVPVVILSNLDRDEELKRCLTLGAADFIIKNQHAIKEVIQKISACVSPAP